MMKMTVFQSIANGSSGSPSIAIPAPWDMLASMSRNAAGFPLISRPTSNPSFIPSFACASRDRALAHVQGERHAHLPRELQPVRVDVRDDDVPSARVPDDRRRHQADRSGAGDQHVLAENRELQRRVHRVAERVEDRRDVAVDGTLVVPDVRHRQRDVLGERAGPVHADPFRERAEVAPSGHAVAAPSADHVALAAHEVARVEVADVRADLR